MRAAKILIKHKAESIKHKAIEADDISGYFNYPIAYIIRFNSFMLYAFRFMLLKNGKLYSPVFLSACGCFITGNRLCHAITYGFNFRSIHAFFNEISFNGFGSFL